MCQSFCLPKWQAQACVARAQPLQVTQQGPCHAPYRIKTSTALQHKRTHTAGSCRETRRRACRRQGQPRRHALCRCGLSVWPRTSAGQHPKSCTCARRGRAHCAGWQPRPATCQALIAKAVYQYHRCSHICHTHTVRRTLSEADNISPASRITVTTCMLAATARVLLLPNC